MAFATARVSEMPLRSLPLSSTSPSYRVFSSPLPNWRSYSFSAAFSYSSSSWHDKKPSHENSIAGHCRSSLLIKRYNALSEGKSYVSGDKAQDALDRIVLRLRNLGLDESGEEPRGENETVDNKYSQDSPITGKEKLGELLEREWIRPDAFLLSEDDSDREDGNGSVLLPWEREEKWEKAELRQQKKRRVSKAPTLAELTMEDEELRRLRRNGLLIRERITIPKAGITQQILEKIHDKWRKEELVRLKFHEVFAHDMKTAHEIVERRTGGMVTWRSGSVMVVFRGPDYQGPVKSRDLVNVEGNPPFVPNVSLGDDDSTNIAESTTEQVEVIKRRADDVEEMTEEEAEYNSLLDGLGPRFEEWWGTGYFPVDADKLPQKIPGYMTPFRLLPTGMRSKLTNAEMTNLRKLSKSLPCHFALGRNRNHQGMAVAILKLWEKSLVAKIAVKRGIQNTNNKLMAEELKTLTGGVLLLRNKYYIVMYRGKDFVPKEVAVALAERREAAKQSQDMEEIVRCKMGSMSLHHDEGKAQLKQVQEVCSKSVSGDIGKGFAGTLAEFYDAQARWQRDISPLLHEKMVEEEAKAKRARLIKRIEHKVEIAHAKKHRAERLLAKIEASMIGAGPDHDQETITDEERAMFRRVGLRMNAFLPLGIRGIFDGVIENMHLHWKHRELVKLISKEKTLEYVKDTARLLEYESGGMLVAIERVPKGYALIYYRGKNYRRPIRIRPRNLLNKAKALKRAVAIQRHEALSQHIHELETAIEQMKKDLGHYEGSDNNLISLEQDLFAPESYGEKQYQDEDVDSIADEMSDGYEDDDLYKEEGEDEDDYSDEDEDYQDEFGQQDD